MYLTRRSIYGNLSADNCGLTITGWNNNEVWAYKLINADTGYTNIY